MLKSSPAGLVGAGIALVMEVAYLSIILAEGDDPIVGVVMHFLVVIGAAGVAIGLGSLRVTPRRRAALLWPAAAGLLAVGILAIFSIGLPLLVAGGLAAVVAHGAAHGAMQAE
ncbi:MAG: hypothetical protein ACR2HM_09695 [Acidimicrobiales bacterium]